MTSTATTLPRLLGRSWTSCAGWRLANMIAVAFEAERRAYLEAHASEVDTRQAPVVGNGYARERQTTTAAGRVAVKAPRVDDRRDGAKFTSAILSPYMLKSPESHRGAV